MPALFAAAALASRLALNTLPPNNLGLAAEVVKDRWVLRMDTAYMLTPTYNRGDWSVTLGYSAWRLGEIEVGPLLGVNGGLPGTPPGLKEIVLVGGPGPNLTVGASIRWQNDQWWVSACPNVSLDGLLRGSFGGPVPVNPFHAILGCPPILEVGYELTPELGVALRASYLPFGVSWKF